MYERLLTPFIQTSVWSSVYAEVIRALVEHVEESAKGMSGTESIWPPNFGKVDCVSPNQH